MALAPAARTFGDFCFSNPISAPEIIPGFKLTENFLSAGTLPRAYPINVAAPTRSGSQFVQRRESTEARLAHEARIVMSQHAV